LSATGARGGWRPCPSDTGLSREEERAEDLARALKDAQITAIYTTSISARGNG
jgi:hypothetical protein